MGKKISFKVIAEYPGMRLKVGDILTLTNGKYQATTTNGYEAFEKRYLLRFPHLFQLINN